MKEDWYQTKEETKDYVYGVERRQYQDFNVVRNTRRYLRMLGKKHIRQI